MAKKKKEGSFDYVREPEEQPDVYEPKVKFLCRLVGLTEQELKCLDEALLARGFTESKETLRQLGPSAFSTLAGIYVGCCPTRNKSLLLELYQKDSLGNGEELEA